jgi:hypothetical protein
MWEEWKYRLCRSRASWWWWMFFLKLCFHNWHIWQMRHMGRVVSSQLVVLLAISTVAGEKTQKMKCMNPTAHKATYYWGIPSPFPYTVEVFYVLSRVRVPSYSWIAHFTLCFALFDPRISLCVLCFWGHMFHFMFFSLSLWRRLEQATRWKNVSLSIWPIC